jgi:hypothetical protein
MGAERQGAYVSSRRTLTIRSWGLITPAAAFIGRLVDRRVVGAGRFDRTVGCVGLLFARMLGCLGGLGSLMSFCVPGLVGLAV